VLFLPPAIIENVARVLRTLADELDDLPGKQPDFLLVDVHAPSSAGCRRRPSRRSGRP
jgi:hypothetical protein